MRNDKLPAALAKRVKFDGRTMTAKSLIDHLIDELGYHELVVLQRKSSNVYSLRKGRLKVLFVTAAEKSYIDDKLKELNIDIPNAVQPTTQETAEIIQVFEAEPSSPPSQQPTASNQQLPESEDYFQDVVRMDTELSGANHVLRAGKIVIDKLSHKRYIMQQFNEKDIVLQHKPYFKNEKAYDMSISYPELINRFKQQEIEVEGFSQNNHAAFVKAVKELLLDLKLQRETSEKTAAAIERDQVRREKEFLDFIEDVAESNRYYQLPDGTIFCIEKNKKNVLLKNTGNQVIEKEPTEQQAILQQLFSNELPDVTQQVTEAKELKQAKVKTKQSVKNIRADITEKQLAEKQAHDQKVNKMRSTAEAQRRRISNFGL